MREKPDCRACGLCCVNVMDTEQFVSVLDEDIECMPARTEAKHVVHVSGGTSMRSRWVRTESGPHKGRRVCVCTALRGSILSRVSCSIYDNRPDVCREALKPGDRTCREVRREVCARLEGEES